MNALFSSLRLTVVTSAAESKDSRGITRWLDAADSAAAKGQLQDACEHLLRAQYYAGYDHGQKTAVLDAELV